MDYKDVFAAIVQGSEDGSFRVTIHLVNPTDKKYKVYMNTGAFQGDMDGGLLNLGWRKLFPEVLQPHSSMVIDRMDDPGELDFMSYYNITLKNANEATDVRYDLVSVNGWSVYFHDDDYCMLPVLNKIGRSLTPEWRKVGRTK